MGYLLKKNQAHTSEFERDICKILRPPFILAHPLFWEDITYKYSIRSSINIVWVGRNRWRLNCVYSVCSWLLLSSYDHTFFCVLRNSRGISPGTSTPEMLPGAEQVPRCSYILKLIIWIKMSYYDSLIPRFMRLLNLF